MPKIRLILAAVTISLILLAMLVLPFRKADRTTRNQTLGHSSDGIEEILPALSPPSAHVKSTNIAERLIERLRRQQPDLADVLQALSPSWPEATSTNRQESVESRLNRQREALSRLRLNIATYLPGLMEEVYAVGRLEATNRNAASGRMEALALAFGTLGGEARPLLPLLIEEFRAGRSIGPCVIAFQSIGGKECGLILVSGLTNSDRLVRNAAMSVLPSFSTNRDVAISALPSLLVLLNDGSPFSRALACSVLGTLQTEANTILPALLQVARDDSDFVARVSAIKAIGHFGTNAAAAKPDLEAILSADQEPHVRRITGEVLRKVGGKDDSN